MLFSRFFPPLFGTLFRKNSRELFRELFRKNSRIKVRRSAQGQKPESVLGKYPKNQPVKYPEEFPELFTEYPKEFPELFTEYPEEFPELFAEFFPANEPELMLEKGSNARKKICPKNAPKNCQNSSLYYPVRTSDRQRKNDKTWTNPKISR